MYETTVMPVDLRAEKKMMRTAVLARRDALSPEEVQARSTAIAIEILRLPMVVTADTISSYLAIGNEVQTEALIRALLGQGKRVILPRTVPGERRLALHEIADLDHLVTGPYGIREPSPTTPEIPPTEVELFLVPGSVFDAAGNRVGYGVGYYDSLLVLSEGWRVGLAYAFQLAPRVIAAEHDMPMDVIATDLGLIDCAQGQRATDYIRLRKMTFFGHHGAYPEERAAGIHFEVDVEMRLDLQTPGMTDDLATTVDYPAVSALIDHLQSAQQFHLFEAMTAKIAEAILQAFPPVVEVTVRTRKHHPPINELMEAFEVEMTRTRPTWVRL